LKQDVTQGSRPDRPRDPEDRTIDAKREQEKRERAHDKKLADSFPTSDPPSSIPDPGEEDILDKTA